MSETPLEEVITEKAFAAMLGTQAEMFYRLGNTLLASGTESLGRGHFFQVLSESDSLEALLDDYGARHNRSFSTLRELIASLRGLTLAGFSLAHLEARFESYHLVLAPREVDGARAAIQTTKSWIESKVRCLFEAAREEGRLRGLRIHSDTFPENRFNAHTLRHQLPRNMGQEDLADDGQTVAEVASKFIGACRMLDEIGVRRIVDPGEREAWLADQCSEEKARVIESTVHNLQSAYDTWVKNTVIEAGDPRLSKLRGHASAALHLLEAVTHLTHFVERHESGQRNEALERRIGALVEREVVREHTLNHLLHWAALIMKRGRPLAEDLLPSYTNVQTLVVTLPDDVAIHARPAALIVGIVNRYGTPVEMQVEKAKCNAASILELLVAVGSHPNAKRFVFRGDEKPLTDIRVLFECHVGEGGIDALPETLGYLRSNA